MAKKRERKPQKPETDLESVFSGISNEEGREEQTEVLPDGLPEFNDHNNTGDPFSAILDKPIGKTSDPPSPVALPEANTVDEFIRKQVLTDMYGTETPSEYDKISLALKNLL